MSGARRRPVPTLKYALGSDWGKHVGNVDVTSSLNGRSNTQREDLKIANMLNLTRSDGAMDSASDSRSEGCVFKSRPGHVLFIFSNQKLINLS